MHYQIPDVGGDDIDVGNPGFGVQTRGLVPRHGTVAR